MTDEQRLLTRVAVNRKICGGRPHIRGTRIHIGVILDALTWGLAPEEIVDHYPCLEMDDVRAAVVFAIRLAEHNGGIASLGRPYPNPLFQLR